MEFLQTESKSYNKSKHDEEGQASDLEKKRIRMTPFIPVLCIVDVFLSSHFTPFRGHFAPPPPINESLKKDKAEGKDDRGEAAGSEDCSAFHSVVSSQGEADFSRKPSEPLSLSPPLARVDSTLSNATKTSGSGSQKSERRSSSNSNTASGDFAAYLNGSDAEGSSPTYIDLRTNTTISGSACKDYLIELRTRRSTFDETAAVDLRTKSSVKDYSWRRAHPSNLDQSEILLTFDRDGVLKVWAIRRRELSIPVTTATRSISGAGTSCIVSGNFQQHVNPDVSLLMEKHVLELVSDSVTSSGNKGDESIIGSADSVSVSWMNHLICPESEQKSLSRHDSSSQVKTTLSPIYSPDTNNTNNSSSDSFNGKESGERGNRNKGVSDIHNSHSSDHHHDGGASGIWLSVTAPYSLLGDHCDTNCDTTDGADSGSDHNLRDRDKSHVDHLQYHFICLNVHPLSHQTQVTVRGKGPIIRIGSAMFPPSSAATRNSLLSSSFSSISQSFVSGRFGSDGMGDPFSVEIVTVLKDTATAYPNYANITSLLHGYNEQFRGIRRPKNCLVKVINGYSQRIRGPKQSFAKNPLPLSKAVPHRIPRSDSRGLLEERKGGFTVFPLDAYDLLYSDVSPQENNGRVRYESNSGTDSSGVDEIQPDSESFSALTGPENRGQRIDLSGVLPSSRDSLAGNHQATLSSFDTYGHVLRVSCPSFPSSSSSSSSSSSGTTVSSNMQVLSRLGLAEQQLLRSTESETISHEILPIVLEIFGLADMTFATQHFSSSIGSAVHSVDNSDKNPKYSVIRAIVVPYSALEGSGSGGQTKQMQSFSTSRNRTDSMQSSSSPKKEQLLIVLLQSKQYGLQVVLWTDGVRKVHKRSKSEGEDADDGYVPSTPTSYHNNAITPRTPREKVAPLSIDAWHGEGLGDHSGEYTVEILPDSQFGLGLRLDVRDNAIIGEAAL